MAADPHGIECGFGTEGKKSQKGDCSVFEEIIVLLFGCVGNTVLFML